MRAIIAAQGSHDFDHHHPALGPLTLEVTAPCDGVVIGMDNLQIAHIARLAGAPKVQGAGVDLCVKLGDPVRAGQVLYRVYAEYPADLAFARQACTRASGCSLGEAGQVPQVFVEF
jgi:thymidine phosphorylase